MQQNEKTDRADESLLFTRYMREDISIPFLFYRTITIPFLFSFDIA